MRKGKKLAKLLAVTMMTLSLSATEMTGVPFTGSGSVAEAATGLNMSGTTIRCYPYSNSNFPVYNVTSSNKKKIGTCYGRSDLITITGVGTDGWSAIEYPIAGGKTKSGYALTSYLFANPDFGGDSGIVQNNITVYTKASCSVKFGTTTKNDTVFILGYAEGNTQILYPTSSCYKAGFIRGKYVISGNKLVSESTSSSLANTNPVISNVKISNLTAEGYTVTCSVSSNVTRVAMPTWSSTNGQDDLIWHQASLSGSTATFTVRTKEHKGDTGSYNTDIYAYTQSGNYTCYCNRDITVPASSGNSTSTAAMADSIVSIAKGEVGQKERSSNSDDIKYNDWYYNKRVNNNGYAAKYAWCAVFVSWCANQAGISESVIPKEANVASMKAALVKNGGSLHLKGSGYTPSKGDIIFFSSNNRLSHVGIVDYTSGTTVFYIDGNNTQTTPHGVHYSSCSTSASKVYGYVTPKYN